MADQTRKLGINDIISLSDDLIGILKAQRDVDDLTRVFDSIAELRSSCSRDDVESLICMEDVKQKIDTCRQEIEGHKETIAEDELKCLQNELDCELQQEEELHQKLREIVEQIDDFESKRVYIEERKKDLMSVKKEDTRAQSEISLYASVTNVIPDMVDRTRISGYIVDRDKRKMDNFSFDPAKASDYEICNSLWRMGDI